MSVREIKPGVYAVGAIDWDRRLFDELIPLPEGTTYNAYLVKGEGKTALIDTVDPTKEEVLVENLRSLGVKRLDYVISHHGEQDHSGAIPGILNLYPEARVVANQKNKELLKEFLLISEKKFITIKDGERLSLGNKTLEFIFAPWVHWPETMLTHLKEDKILFTCDLFGSHLATSALFVTEGSEIHTAAKRYYAEIMMPFRTSIKRHLEKIKSLEIDIIAPSHGPIYKKPEFIIGLYHNWVSDEVKNEIVIPYVSMHGSVDKMVSYFTDTLMERGITVKPFNLPRTDIGELAMALVDAATIVIASPMVLAGPHPAVIYAAHLVSALRPKSRVFSIIGSYGWGGKMVEKLKGILENLRVEILEPVIVKGYPEEGDFKALDRLAGEILKKHNIIKKGGGK